MTLREFTLWERYRGKYGPLSPVRKYDQMGAIVASQINRAHGGKSVPNDFLPYRKVEETIVEADDFIALAMIGEGVKRGR